MAKPWQIADIDPNEPLRVSLRRTLLGWMQEMLSYESDTMKGTDPEALHDMRVSARRLRAIAHSKLSVDLQKIRGHAQRE